MVGALLSQGGDVFAERDDGATALHLAVFDEAPACLPVVMRLLLAGGPMLRDRPDASGKTPLMVGAKFGHTEAANALLAGGADVSLQDRKGKTALIHAAKAGYDNLVDVLLKHGASIDHQVDTRCTGLAIAAERGQLDVVRLLLRRGADPRIADEHNRPPLFLAALEGPEGTRPGVCRLSRCRWRLRGRRCQASRLRSLFQDLPRPSLCSRPIPRLDQGVRLQAPVRDVLMAVGTRCGVPVV